MAGRPANRLSKLISSLHKKLPGVLHQPAQTLAFNSQVLLLLELLPRAVDARACEASRVVRNARSWHGAGRDRHCVHAQLQVKYAGTSGVWIEKMGEDEVVMTLKNRFRSAPQRVRKPQPALPRKRLPPPMPLPRSRNNTTTCCPRCAELHSPHLRSGCKITSRGCTPAAWRCSRRAPRARCLG